MAAADSLAEGDLSARVAERGSRQFNQLVRSFNRMASELERNDQLRRNLTADVAHELRTPLHIIQGNLEGILDGVYDPSTDHISATLEETRLLARLVDDLRTLSLAEAGQLQLRMEDVELCGILEDVGTSFSGQAESQGISLLVDCAESVTGLSMTLDAGRINQVLSNLVVNALRHTPTGGVTLRASRTAEGVQITVEDTGEGISSDDLPHIFDRFWRGDRSRTRTSGVGGGLGLSIARQLIQSHNGRIEVESVQGAGTTFTIWLPFGED
jgi:signal transduction histidine kinase